MSAHLSERAATIYFDIMIQRIGPVHALFFVGDRPPGAFADMCVSSINPAGKPRFNCRPRAEFWKNAIHDLKNT